MPWWTLLITGVVCIIVTWVIVCLMTMSTIRDLEDDIRLLQKRLDDANRKK